MPTVTGDSLDSMKNTESPWLEIFKMFAAQIRNLVTLNVELLIIYQKNKKNNDASCFLLAFLDKLIIKKNGFRDKINQFLLSQDTWQMEKSEPNETISQIQMCINNLKVSKCALEGNLLSGSHRTQVVEYQINALIIRLAELP